MLVRVAAVGTVMSRTNIPSMGVTVVLVSKAFGGSAIIMSGKAFVLVRVCTKYTDRASSMATTRSSVRGAAAAAPSASGWVAVLVACFAGCQGCAQCLDFILECCVRLCGDDGRDGAACTGYDAGFLAGTGIVLCIDHLVDYNPGVKDHVSQCFNLSIGWLDIACNGARRVFAFREIVLVVFIEVQDELCLRLVG